MDNPPVTATDLTDFADLQNARRYVNYSPELGDTILGLYVEGASFTDISELTGMPSYQTILRWMKDSDKFQGGIEMARRLRAIHFEERALKLAVAGRIDKDDVPGERLKFDVLKWATETHHPEQFGKKVTVEGNSKKPIVFKIVTGVPEPQGEHQRAVELNADGTQKKPDILVSSSAAEPETLGPGNSEVENHGEVAPAGEVAGSTPAPATPLEATP